MATNKNQPLIINFYNQANEVAGLDDKIDRIQKERDSYRKLEELQLQARRSELLDRMRNGQVKGRLLVTRGPLDADYWTVGELYDISALRYTESGAGQVTLVQSFLTGFMGATFIVDREVELVVVDD